MAEQLVYSNGITLDSDFDTCGLFVARPIQDDPVKHLEIGPLGNIEVKFFQGATQVTRVFTNPTGYFAALLDEGTYEVKIEDDNFKPFDATVTLAMGERAPYVGYMLQSKDSTGQWDDLIITPPELRSEYLFGLILVDRFGRPYSDENIAQFIRKSQATVERRCDINILPRKILATASEASAIDSGFDLDDFDIIEPGYDYSFNDFQRWTFLKLNKRPLLFEVKVIKLIYPVGLSVFDLPEEWIRTYFQASQIQVVPTAGALSRVFMLPSGQFAPMVSWYLPGQIPQVFQISYDVGLIDKEGKRNRHFPENVFDEARHLVGLLAAVEVLGVTGDAILAGVASQSISGDGISESFSTTASATSATYQARIESYRKDLLGRTQGEPGVYENFKNYWSQISLVVA